jgi:hypothetical protein
VPEEPGASPPSDQLGTDGSAATAANGTGSSTSHYESIEPALRAAAIEERGMKTRIQLTGYLKGKYIQGQADNFIVPDIMAEAVQAALAPIKEIANKLHLTAVGAGTALAKGGPRVRIQLTEYATNGGEYLRQDGSTSKPQNLSIASMTVEQVSKLVDYQLALHFGVRRGDAGALVKAWGAFAGIETVDGSAGPTKKDDRKDERGASDSVVENSGNTVQGVVLDGYGMAILLPDLLERTYSKKLHLGLCAVVTGSNLRVMSLWKQEIAAKIAAKRAGARVVDAQGFLISWAEIEAAEIAPDEAQA